MLVSVAIASLLLAVAGTATILFIARMVALFTARMIMCLCTSACPGIDPDLANLGARKPSGAWHFPRCLRHCVGSVGAGRSACPASPCAAHVVWSGRCAGVLRHRRMLRTGATCQTQPWTRTTSLRRACQTSRAGSPRRGKVFVLSCQSARNAVARESNAVAPHAGAWCGAGRCCGRRTAGTRAGMGGDHPIRATPGGGLRCARPRSMVCSNKECDVQHELGNKAPGAGEVHSERR